MKNNIKIKFMFIVMLCLSLSLMLSTISMAETVFPLDQTMYGVDYNATRYTSWGPDLIDNGDTTTIKSKVVSDQPMADGTVAFSSWQPPAGEVGIGNFSMKLRVVDFDNFEKTVLHITSTPIINFVIDNGNTKGLYITSNYGAGAQSNIVNLPENIESNDIEFKSVQQADYSYKFYANDTELIPQDGLYDDLSNVEGNFPLYFKLWGSGGGIEVKQAAGAKGIQKPFDPSLNPVSDGSFDIANNWQFPKKITAISNYIEKTIKFQGASLAWGDTISSKNQYNCDDITIEFKVLTNLDRIDIHIDSEALIIWNSGGIQGNGVSGSGDWALSLNDGNIIKLQIKGYADNRQVYLTDNTGTFREITPSIAGGFNAFKTGNQYIHFKLQTGTDAKQGIELLSINGKSPLGLWEDGDLDYINGFDSTNSSLKAHNDYDGVGIYAGGQGWGNQLHYLRNNGYMDAKNLDIVFGARVFEETSVRSFEVIFYGKGSNKLIVRFYDLGSDEYGYQIYKDWTANDLLGYKSEIQNIDLEEPYSASALFKVQLRLYDDGKIENIIINNETVQLSNDKSYAGIIFEDCNAKLSFQMPDSGSGVNHNDLNRITLFSINGEDFSSHNPVSNIILSNKFGVFDYNMQLEDIIISGTQGVFGGGSNLNSAVFGYMGQHNIPDDAEGYSVNFYTTTANYDDLNYSFILRGSNIYYELKFQKSGEGYMVTLLDDNNQTITCLDNQIIPENNYYTISFKTSNNTFYVNNQTLATGTNEETLYKLNNASTQFSVSTSTKSNGIIITGINGQILKDFTPEPNIENNQSNIVYETDAFSRGTLNVTNTETGTVLNTTGDWLASWKTDNVLSNEGIFSVYFSVLENNYDANGINVVFRNLAPDKMYTDGYIIRLSPSGSSTIVTVYDVAFNVLSTTNILINMDMSAEDNQYLVEYDDNSNKIYVNKMEIAGNFNINLPVENTQFGIVHSNKASKQSSIIIYGLNGGKITNLSPLPNIESTDPNIARREYEISISTPDNDALKDYNNAQIITKTEIY